MRGLKTLLLEQQDLAYGTTSCFHGLPHIRRRYVLKDQSIATDYTKKSKVQNPQDHHLNDLDSNTPKR